MVLAGGQGSRLGGNKPWRTVGGRRFIDLVLAAVAAVTPRQVVVTGQVEAMADLACLVLADRWPGQGPLAALVTAFLDCPAEHYLVVPVDAPLVRPALLARLAGQAGRCRACTVRGPRGVEPLMAYSARSCLPNAQRLLAAGDRRPRSLLASVRAQVLDPAEAAAADPGALSFINVNFPEDLAKAEELCGRSGAIAT